MRAVSQTHSRALLLAIKLATLELRADALFHDLKSRHWLTEPRVPSGDPHGGRWTRVGGALVWVESYTEPNGKTVTGFKPGFMLGPIMKKGRDPRWTLAKLPDGTELYVLPPLLRWSVTGQYIIEKIKGFAMYSIQPPAAR